MFDNAVMEFTQTYLRTVFDFDRESGKLYWAMSHQLYPGQEAGYVNVDRNGYKRRMVHIHGKMRMVHRLIWLMEYGDVPRLIDHRDGNGLDNRLNNLRAASKAQNAANRGATRKNKLGVKGVRRVGNRYHANIRVNYERIHLGSFTELEQAATAYQIAAERYFGEFAKT